MPCSAIIVPLVLFLSVLLLQLLLFALRRPFLHLVYLCAKSDFVRSKLSFISDISSLPSAVPSSARSAQLDEEAGGAGGGAAAQAAGKNHGVARSSSSSSSQRIVRAGFWRTLADNCVTTALATSLFVYLTIARVGFSMLLCVKVGGSDRWVLDVRLQCPVVPPYTSWGIGAILLGVFLLCVCVAWPVGIAWVLIHKAHRGELLRVAPYYKAGAGSAATAGPHSGPTVATTARLAVRYADYAVDYDALIRYYAKARGLSGWQWLCTLGSSLSHMRVYAVLVMDSILDLHRFMVALISLLVMLHELHQCALLILCLSSYLLLVLLVRPWRALAVLRLQVTALAVLIASCLGIMACNVQDARAGGYYSDYAVKRYTAVIPWVVIAVNAAYLLLVLGMLVRCVLQEAPSVAEVRAWWVAKKRQAARQRVMQDVADGRYDDVLAGRF